MGNSGSIHNIASEIDDLTPYVQNDVHLSDHHPLKWAQSFPRDNNHHHHHQQQQQQQQHHIKVLPDLNEGPRLRFTANGAILQSGGTISGRKDSIAPPPLLQRSRTSINYDLGHKNNSDAFNRSKHKFSHIQDRQLQDTSYKRFGSEPDLRVNGDEKINGVNQAKISKSKMVKNKKKKAAPPPPQDSQQDITPLSSTEHQNIPANNSNQKKLRLFKTKAESRKTSIQPRLTTEASDLHFKRPTPPSQRSGAEPLRRKGQFLPTNMNDSKNNVHLDSNWQESIVTVLPVAAFRREKSFDVSLLASHHKLSTEEAIKTSRERQRISTTLDKPIPPERLLAKRQVSADTERPIIKSPVESKIAMRKYSQPAQLTSTDFKKELEEATKRRSLIVDIMEKDFPVKRDQEKNLKLLGQSVSKTKTAITRNRIESQRKDQNSFTTEKPCISLPPQETKKRPESKIPQLTKTFYFGMEGKKEVSSKKESENFGKIQMKVIDEFAKNIMTNQRTKRAGSESSESALSSEDGYPSTGVTGGYEENTNGGIHVHVRPMLPRRQLEIPRFSPAAAWRMLNDEQKDVNNFFSRNAAHQFTSEVVVESKQPLEERIQRIYREPNPLYSDNKSGDSGISGDAGLPERTESPRQNFTSELEIERPSPKVGPFLKPWIPQQDLEEETSSDGEVPKINDGNTFSNRSHVFSLSLPREGHLTAYEEKEKPGFSSLQKLKKTVSNALFNTSDRITSYRSDNWLLSRSAPNSIENTQMTPAVGNPSNHKLAENDTLDHRHITIQPSPFSYFTGNKHVMYLPNHPIGESSDYQNLDRVGSDLDRSNSPDVDSCGKNRREGKYSSSKNNKSSYLVTKERESLQDLTVNMKDEGNLPKANSSKNRGHRFTFQSTVRQIERRRIAEKLSKEAEEKEAQRLSELEAMRKVEEDFQRKRAREKASIRHQLRLFSLEESQCTSLPVDWQLDGSQPQRAEPDGAVSSPTPSPTSPDSMPKPFYHEHEPLVRKNSIDMKGHQQVYVPGTEILSEFRTMRREYLQYRSDRNKTDFRSDQQTEHPPVVCKIPYSRSGNEANIYRYDEDYAENGNSMLLDNYRRNFARGQSICSSDSEFSTPSGEGAVDRRSRYRCRSPSPSL